MTLPEATVLLDWVVTVPTVNPAPVIAEPAAACVSPITFGTLTEVEPPEPPESPPPPQAVRISAAMIATELFVIQLMAFIVMCSFHPVIGILELWHFGVVRTLRSDSNRDPGRRDGVGLGART
jgi:hypothetical protein